MLHPQTPLKLVPSGRVPAAPTPPVPDDSSPGHPGGLRFCPQPSLSRSTIQDAEPLPNAMPLTTVPTAGPVLVPRLPALPALSPAAALAHDARSALTSLHLLAGLLGEPGVLAAHGSTLAADLATVAGALGSMVEQLATLAGQATGELSILVSPAAGQASSPHRVPAASAGAALENCRGLLRGIVGPGVAMYLSAESGLPPLALNDDSLLRVLMNLVRNAGEAMGAGVVRITARRALSLATPAVLIHVADNGPGMSAHLLGRIFEPGFSTRLIDTAEGPGRNRGLGLSIVRELVEAVGGQVEVASTRRRGTTFELRIPARPMP